MNSQDGINSGIVLSYEPYQNKGRTIDSKLATSLFGGYASGSLRIGVEFNQLLDSNVAIQIKIFSGYGNYNLNSKVSIFTRIDYLHNVSVKVNYIIFGLAISPEIGLKLMPNIRYNSHDNTKTVTNYNINFEFKI